MHRNQKCSLTTDVCTLDCCLCRSRRYASGGVSCKGHELRRGTPDFRSASHCMELPNIERILAVNTTF